MNEYDQVESNGSLVTNTLVNSGAPRILLVAFDLPLSRSLSRVLRADGFDITTCLSFDAARDRLALIRFTLVAIVLAGDAEPIADFVHHLAPEIGCALLDTGLWESPPTLNCDVIKLTTDGPSLSEELRRLLKHK